MGYRILAAITILFYGTACQEPNKIPNPLVIDKSVKEDEIKNKLAAKKPSDVMKSDIGSDSTQPFEKQIDEGLSIIEKIRVEEKREESLGKFRRRNTKKLSEAESKRQPKDQHALNKYKRARRFALAGNLHEAKNLYLESCQIGHKESCHKFAYYEQRAGNFANAQRFYQISCEAGILKSCNNLGYGMELVGRLESARNFYADACLNRHQAACKNLARIIRKESHRSR